MKAAWYALTRFLYRRTIVLLVVLFVAGTAAITWDLSRLTTRLIHTEARSSSAAYSDSLSAFRALYTSEVVARVQGHGIEVTADYKGKPGTIPLPVTLTFELAKLIGERGTGVRARLYSDFPFPSRKNGGPRDAFEREALRELRQDPSRPFFRFETFEGHPSIRYATADIMKPDCVACHDSRPDSPKRDWKVGDVRGVLEVIRPLDQVIAQTHAGLRNTVILMSVMGLLGLVALGLVIGRLGRMSSDLAQQVEARTAELETANHDLEAFNYSVAHDLRAPLRAMDGFSAALLEDYAGKLDEKGRDYLRRVRAAAQRMGQLIDDMLRLSRVSRGELVREDVDLSQLARAIAAELGNTAPERHVEFLLQDGVSARGDPHLLRLALQNLLENAWKFTRTTAEARIELGAKRTDRELVCFIRDNGVGFDMAYADKLFVPFQRLHSPAEFPGLGIGLAIVQRIIRRHGGRVWAEGAVGRGASFYFAVPNGRRGGAQ